MLRVKIPYGSVTPDQLDMLGHIAETYSRGWGHLTTRQNVQFHYVQLDAVPAALRDLATTGLITREACGDTVRNVQRCHPAGACPHAVLQLRPWAEADFTHFPHTPLPQPTPHQPPTTLPHCHPPSPP